VASITTNSLLPLLQLPAPTPWYHQHHERATKLDAGTACWLLLFTHDLRPP